MSPRLILVALAFLQTGFAHIRAGDDANAPFLRWSRGHPVPIHVHSAGYSQIPFAQLRAAIEGSLATWTAADRSNLVFVRGGRDGDTPAVDGNNVVRFEERALPPEIDPRSTLAWTSPVSVSCTGIIIEADITFNAVTFEWTANDNVRENNVETVALHEFGHLLGLDHSNNQRAVMFPSVQQRIRHALHADDLAGVQAIYDARRGIDCVRDADCRLGEVCLFTIDSTDTLGAFCGQALGAADPGARCSVRGGPCDSGCANGLCFNDNLCSAVCGGDGDCPQGWSCLAQDVDGAATSFCVDVQRCDGPGTCPAGRACGISVDANSDLLLVCVDSGPRPDGAACAVSTECAGGICLGGTCRRLCDDASDCTDGWSCDSTEIGLGGGRSAPVDLCALPDVPCARDRDCPEGQICRYVEQGGRLANRCGPDAGGAGVGQRCRQDADCAAGICLGGRACSAICRNDGDCPDNMECGRVQRGEQSLPACLFRPGAPQDARPPDPVRDAEPPVPTRDAAPPEPMGDVGPAAPDAGTTIGDAERARDASGGPVIISSSASPDDGGCAAAPGRSIDGTATLLLLIAFVRRRLVRT